jgi:predicted S18 family serine protease
VGGIAQKAIACREQGVELFLVPSANAVEACRYAGPVKVVGVRTLEEALAYLGEPGIP